MSDDAVEIRFTADLSDLEAGTEEAAALLGRAGDALAHVFEQQSLKEIAIATDRNDALYRLGMESLESWRAQAIAEADQKYSAELSYLDRKETADKSDAAAELRDAEERRIAYEDHVLALEKIDERYAEEKQARDKQALADAISADNARLQSGLRALDTAFRTHQIGADERFRLEQELTDAIYGEELKRLDALIATLAAGTKAYEDAIRDRQKIEQDFARQSQTNTDRLETEEAQKWAELGNSIRSSFNSALDGMIFQGRSFQQFLLQVAQGVLKAFIQMGETIAENWIEEQMSSLFATKAAQTTSSVGQITDAAAVAGANTFAATAAIPIVGPELAPGAAAAAIAQVMGYTSLLSLATGTNYVPRDMPAFLHKGEAVIPARYNNTMNGGDVHLHYGPTNNMVQSPSLKQMLQTDSAEMLSWLQRAVRNGSLRMA